MVGFPLNAFIPFCLSYKVAGEMIYCTCFIDEHTLGHNVNKALFSIINCHLIRGIFRVNRNIDCNSNIIGHSLNALVLYKSKA